MTSSYDTNEQNTLNEIIGLTKQLISFRTTADRTDEIKKCIDFIQKSLRGQDLYVKRHESNGKLSLWISFNRKKKQKIILNCHIDIVDGQDAQFQGKVKNNILYGKGAYDMKAAAAIFMTLMKHFSQMKNKPSIGLMVVSDEETGGLNGTKYLIKKGYKCDFCI